MVVRADFDQQHPSRQGRPWKERGGAFSQIRMTIPIDYHAFREEGDYYGNSVVFSSFLNIDQDSIVAHARSLAPLRASLPPSLSVSIHTTTTKTTTTTTETTEAAAAAASPSRLPPQTPPLREKAPIPVPVHTLAPRMHPFFVDGGSPLTRGSPGLAPAPPSPDPFTRPTLRAFPPPA